MPERTARAFVLRQGPVDGFGELFWRGKRGRELTRRWWHGLGVRVCTRAAVDAATGDHQVAVRGNFQQVEATAGAVVGAAAVAPGHQAQLPVTQRSKVPGGIDHVIRQGSDFAGAVVSAWVPFLVSGLKCGDILQFPAGLGYYWPGMLFGEWTEAASTLTIFPPRRPWVPPHQLPESQEFP